MPRSPRQGRRLPRILTDCDRETEVAVRPVKPPPAQRAEAARARLYLLPSGPDPRRVRGRPRGVDPLSWTLIAADLVIRRVFRAVPRTRSVRLAGAECLRRGCRGSPDRRTPPAWPRGAVEPASGPAGRIVALQAREDALDRSVIGFRDTAHVLSSDRQESTAGDGTGVMCRCTLRFPFGPRDRSPRKRWEGSIFRECGECPRVHSPPGTGCSHRPRPSGTPRDPTVGAWRGSSGVRSGVSHRRGR